VYKFNKPIYQNQQSESQYQRQINRNCRTFTPPRRPKPELSHPYSNYINRTHIAPDHQTTKTYLEHYHTPAGPNLKIPHLIEDKITHGDNYAHAVVIKSVILKKPGENK